MISSDFTAASLFTNRVLKQTPRNPRLAISRQAMLLRLLAVRCVTRIAICGAAPLAGLWTAMLVRPAWTNSGRFWAWAVAVATRAAAKAQVPSRWGSLMARISSASIGIDVEVIVALGARKVTRARGALGGLDDRSLLLATFGWRDFCSARG